ncbi:MAG: rubredoxin [Methanomicrobiales archaeon]|nr:rubredoxin [Methanomicrobiales archaeon]
MPPKKRTGASARKAGVRKTTTRKAPARKAAVKKTAVKKAAARKTTTRKGGKAGQRYKCKYCNYVYSPQIGEPQNGIPAGTAFDDLPDDYVCPICGMQGKGKIGTWGFEPWNPTRYVCKVCGYIYDQARGEPQHGIRAGTPFEKLPDSYVCPVCGLDKKISREYGKVGKPQFIALMG